jgi:hypothetical protein
MRGNESFEWRQPHKAAVVAVQSRNWQQVGCTIDENGLMSSVEMKDRLQRRGRVPATFMCR